MRWTMHGLVRTILARGGGTMPNADIYRALILERNQVIVDLVRLTLNHGLFVVHAVRDLAEAQGALATWRPHIAIVDMDHDDSTTLTQRLGVSVASPMRGTPVLGLTRRGDLASKLHAFDLGVDDILTVPFSPEELLARSIVITRRATGTDRPGVAPIKLGDIEIDIIGRFIRIGDSTVHLSTIEQSLLYLLASRSGHVVDRDTILDVIWGADYVADSNVVDRHIQSLRNKLQDSYRNPRFIATVPGRGYRFVPSFTNLGWDPGRESR
jgi:DNA-binding response OmpR family regulator